MTVDAPRHRVPYHRAGAIALAARIAGFECESEDETTERILPTLTALLQCLREEREDIVAFFGQRAAIEAEIDELVQQVQNLRKGFDDGFLRYETLVLRARPSG